MRIVPTLEALVLLTASVLLSVVSTSRAQIYEWVDEEDNVQHYTSSLERIPAPARSEARLFIEDTPAPRLQGEAPISKAEEHAESQEDEGSFDIAAIVETFREGMETGLLAAREMEPPPNPPVVVLRTLPPVVVNVPQYDPSGLYYRSPYEGRMSVPFDDGRSLGLTHRQHLQEQRRLERGR